MPATTDRRVRRTRSLLHQALIALILDKGYGRITVQDILDRADVGRSTFYTHYRSKDDLFLASGLEHLRAIFAAEPPNAPHAKDGSAPPLQPALTLFRLADDNRPLYRALIGRRGSDLVTRQARQMLTQVMTEHLRARLAVNNNSQLDLTVAFLVSGLLGLLTWWLDSQTPYSADQIYASFEHLATRGIEQLLGASQLPEHHPSRPASQAHPSSAQPS